MSEQRITIYTNDFHALAIKVLIALGNGDDRFAESMARELAGCCATGADLRRLAWEFDAMGSRLREIWCQEGKR